MQISGAANSPVAFRNISADVPRRQDVDLGRNDANQRSAQERSGNAQARADQIRTEQTQTVAAVQATSRAAEPNAAPQVAEGGGGGEVRGSRLDITI